MLFPCVLTLHCTARHTAAVHCTQHPCHVFTARHTAAMYALHAILLPCTARHTAAVHCPRHTAAVHCTRHTAAVHCTPLHAYGSSKAKPCHCLKNYRQITTVTLNIITVQITSRVKLFHISNELNLSQRCFQTYITHSCPISC